MGCEVKTDVRDEPNHSLCGSNQKIREYLQESCIYPMNY